MYEQALRARVDPSTAGIQVDAGATKKRNKKQGEVARSSTTCVQSVQKGMAAPRGASGQNDIMARDAATYQGVAR